MGRIRKKRVKGFKDTSLESFFIDNEPTPDEPKKQLPEEPIFPKKWDVKKEGIHPHTLESDPDQDQKAFHLQEIVSSLSERPRAKREICNDTNISMNNVSWRIYDHDIETPETNAKGKKVRLSDTFIRVGKKSGKIRGFVYALKDKQYSEEVLNECVEKYGITFFDWYFKLPEG